MKKILFAILIMVSCKCGKLTYPNNAVIVCDGNSLTKGYGANVSYPDQLKKFFPDSKVYNFGVNGQTTEEMLLDAFTQIDTLYNSNVKSIVIAWEVGNDLFYHGNMDQAISNFKKYCNDRRAKGWKVIALTMPPRINYNSVYKSKELYQLAIDSANNILRINYKSFSDGFVDLAEGSRLSKISSTYWNQDNVHLNDAGLSVVAELVRNEILRLP